MERFAARGKVGTHVTNVFIVQQGRPLFTVGAETLEGQPGQIIIVPPETPHKFTNRGPKRSHLVCIHANPTFETEWLE